MNLHVGLSFTESALATRLVTLGTLAALDGPLPVLDFIALVGAAVVIGAYAYNIATHDQAIVNNIASNEGTTFKREAEKSVAQTKTLVASPATRWALEKIFDKETVDLVISKSSKIFSVFDEFVYAFELTVEEIAAAAKSRIIQELGDTVGKGAAQMIGQVVEWLIKYGSKILI